MVVFLWLIVTFNLSTGVLFRTHLTAVGKSNTYVIITKSTSGSSSMADPDENIRIEHAFAVTAQIEKEASVWYANVLAEVGKLYFIKQ